VALEGPYPEHRRVSHRGIIAAERLTRLTHPTTHANQQLMRRSGLTGALHGLTTRAPRPGKAVAPRKTLADGTPRPLAGRGGGAIHRCTRCEGYLAALRATECRRAAACSGVTRKTPPLTGTYDRFVRASQVPRQVLRRAAECCKCCAWRGGRAPLIRRPTTSSPRALGDARHA
jgi:hypothetical protein